MNMELREYLDPYGRSPFGLWRAGLDDIARAKVSVALLRLSSGNSSNVKALGEVLQRAGLSGEIDPAEFRRYGSARKLYNFHVDHAGAY